MDAQLERGTAAPSGPWTRAPAFRTAYDAPHPASLHVWTGFAQAALSAFAFTAPFVDETLAMPVLCFILAIAAIVELALVLRARTGWAHLLWAVNAALGALLLLMAPLVGLASWSMALAFYFLSSAATLSGIAPSQPVRGVLFATAALNALLAIVTLLLQYVISPWFSGVLLGANIFAVAFAHVTLGLFYCSRKRL